MARRPVGLYSAPPMAPIQAAQVQMTPAEALKTYSAFRKEADPNVARRMAVTQGIQDFSGPTTSGSVAEGIIRMLQAAQATRGYRDQAQEQLQSRADTYNDKQAEFDRGVAEKAAQAGQVGAEAGQYSVFGMSKPKPMEVGGRVIDAANNFKTLYEPPPPEMTPYQQEMLDLRRDQMAQTAALAAGRDGSGRTALRDATTLRKELDGLQTTKNYRLTRGAYAQLDAIAKDPSAAGDLSFIFSYMKMLDPESVVREGEFANAQNAAGVPDQVRNLYNKIATGERLNPTQRAQFLDTAKRLMKASEDQYLQDVERYRSYAGAYGADPELVAPARQPADAASSAPEKVVRGPDGKLMVTR